MTSLGKKPQPSVVGRGSFNQIQVGESSCSNAESWISRKKVVGVRLVSQKKMQSGHKTKDSKVYRVALDTSSRRRYELTSNIQQWSCSKTWSCGFAFIILKILITAIPNGMGHSFKSLKSSWESTLKLFLFKAESTGSAPLAWPKCSQSPFLDQMLGSCFLLGVNQPTIIWRLGTSVSPHGSLGMS